MKSMIYLFRKLDSWLTYYESSNTPSYYPTKSPASQTHKGKPNMQVPGRERPTKWGRSTI